MNKRSEYLDCLRGIVMLMVVFSHTCGEFCLNCKDFFWLNRIFSIVMLPGFFFISGWFTTTYNTRWGGGGGGFFLSFKKFVGQTIFFVFVVWCFFFGWGCD